MNADLWFLENIEPDWAEKFRAHLRANKQKIDISTQCLQYMLWSGYHESMDNKRKRISKAMARVRDYVRNMNLEGNAD